MSTNIFSCSNIDIDQMIHEDDLIREIKNKSIELSCEISNTNTIRVYGLLEAAAKLCKDDKNNMSFFKEASLEVLNHCFIN